MLATFLAAWSFAVAATSLWAVVRPRRPWTTRDVRSESALLIRPCAGPELALAQTLGSTAEATRSFPIRVRFAVATWEDGATPSAEAACRALAGMNVEARVIATRAIGPNRKADQLARALSAEGTSESVVIIADSDVDLRNLSLDALLAPLANPNVAAAWAAPCEPAPHTLADRASSAVLDSSLHSFPLLASIDPHGMVGKLVAIRPHALRSIGGFDGLVNFLGEDMEMARRLRAAGFEVVRANVLAPSLAHGRTWRQVVGRYARWMSVVRGQRTALLLAYPGLFFATLPIASLALAVARFDRVAGLVPMALAVSARLFAALVARSRTGHVDRGTSLVADVVLADGLLLVAFVTALVSRTFEWRGIGLRLGPRGQLEENPRPRTTGPKATV